MSHGVLTFTFLMPLTLRPAGTLCAQHFYYLSTLQTWKGKNLYEAGSPQSIVQKENLNTRWQFGVLTDNSKSFKVQTWWNAEIRKK